MFGHRAWKTSQSVFALKDVRAGGRKPFLGLGFLTDCNLGGALHTGTDLGQFGKKRHRFI